MAKNKAKERQRKVVSARRRVEQHETGGERTSIKLPEGVSFLSVKKAEVKRLDIVPFTAGAGNKYADEGELHYERTYYAHRGIGPNNDSYCCLAKNWGKACPICDHKASLVKKGTSNDDDEVKALNWKERQLWCVLDQGEKEKGLQVWDVSHFLFGKYLDEKVRTADDHEYDNFADPVEGMTLRIGVTEEKGGGYTYCKFSDIEFKPRKEPLDPELVESAPCLDDCLIEVPYDKLKKIFLQMGDDDETEEEDEEEDDKPAPKKGGKDKKPAAADDDDDEEKEDTEDDSDLEDDDDPTAKTLGLKVGMAVKYKRSDCEITKISGDGTSLTLEDEDGEKITGVPPNEVTVIEEEEDEEENDKPAKKGGKGKKPAAADDDEDDDEDTEDDLEEEEDEEEEDDPPPAKKPKKK